MSYLRVQYQTNKSTTLAGEAIGKWQMLQPKQNGTILDDGRIELPNILELPFRCQPAPGEWKISIKIGFLVMLRSI